MDAGTDAGLDAGTDAGLDAGTDAGLDAGADAGLDGADGGQVETGCWTESPALGAVHFWVATDGDDEGDGSEQNPFAGPQRAALAVREHIANQGLPAGGLCVVFREGEYALNATWTLSAQDAGQAGSLVTYRAYPGETVRITGSTPLEASWFETHNRIHHAPHTAILFSGNDHLIRFNEIDHVVHESNDAGAIYSGRDWGYRGTLIEHNYFHDIDSVFGGAHGVYLDDAVSGMEVRGNIFSRIHGHATMSGGGRDNLVHHNVIVHIQRSAHYSDRRARTSNDTPGDSWNLIERLQRSNESYEWGSPLDHQAEPWASAYPLLALIPDSPALSIPGFVPSPFDLIGPQ